MNYVSRALSVLAGLILALNLLFCFKTMQLCLYDAWYCYIMCYVLTFVAGIAVVALASTAASMSQVKG